MSVLLALLLSQGAEPRLDYVSKAVPLKVAMEQISKQAGTPLVVDQELELEPLVFRLKGVPLGEFRAKLADCLDAEWKMLSNGAQRLERSQAIRDRLWREQVQLDADALRKALDVAVNNEKLEPYSAGEAQAVASMLLNTEQKLKEDARGNNRFYSQVAPKLPPIRALWRMLQDIDLREIAAIAPGGRVVYSDQPTQKQADLPESATRRIAFLVEEQNFVAEKLTPIDPYTSPMVESDGARRKMTGPPARVVFTVDRSPDATFYGFYLTMLDQSGAEICTARHQLRLATFDLEPDANQPPDLEIELTPFAKELVTFLNWAMGPKTALMKLSPAALDVVTHPEQHEPLSFLVSDILLGWAEKTDQNAIFYPDDFLTFPAMVATTGGTPRLSTFLKGIENAVNVEQEGGWLTFKPVRPLVAIAERSDRATLGEYLRRLRQEGFLSIANSAAYAQTYRGPAMAIIPTFSTILTMTDLAQLELNDSDALRFIGTLDQSQMEGLARGFTARSLRPEQLEAFEPVLYKHTDWRVYMNEALGSEPTEFMPNGIPMDLMIQGEIKETEAFSYTTIQPDGSHYSRTGPAAHIANGIVTEPNFQLVSVGDAVSRTLSITFTLPSEKYKQVQCVESSRKGAEWPVAELPERIKKKIDEEVERVKGYDLPKPEPRPPFLR
jgi:hypothetical protein